MQSEKILSLIEKYKAHVTEHGLKDEFYKWQILQRFQGRPDLNADDFEAEMKSINYENLIYHNGKAVIYHLARERKQEYVEILKVLFDESISLENRVPTFMHSIENLYREIVPDRRYGNHHDERTISTLLTFNNPNKYTFFKNSFYQSLCNLLEIKPQKVGAKYPHYLQLIVSLVDDYIKKDEELISLFKSIVHGNVFLDENYKILTQDILYQSLDKNFGDNRNFWRVGTKDEDDSYWNEMLTQSQISIGWPSVGDLAEQNIKSKQEVIDIFDRLGHYEDKKGVKTRKSGEIFDFYSTAKVGDIVLAQDGHHVLGIAEITDDYNFLSNEHFPHQRTVKWLVTKFTPTFSNPDGPNTSFFKLTNPSLKETVQKYISNQIIYNEKVQDMLTPKNQILYGPPGTGKTHNTINKSLELIGEKLDGMTRKDIKDLFDSKIKEGQIVFTTFHQSMSYEDFIEGIKPKEENGVISYEVVNGIFKNICDAAKTPNQSDFNSAFHFLTEELKGTELLALKTPKGSAFGISLNKNGNLNLHTGANKEKQGTLTKENIQKQINGEDKFIGWEGYFLGVIEYLKSKYNYSATTNDQKNFVLIIDEINRGNVSQIFGELITLIEDEKRSGADEEIKLTLPYSQSEFSVPSNLFIIGTMNTADRSVEALDTALRRRFSFIEMLPKHNLIRTEGTNGGIVGLDIDGGSKPVDLAEILRTINERIEVLVDRDHTIGHSYFLKIGSPMELKLAFQNKIIPLLQEYFYGNYAKMELVIGSKFFDVAKLDKSVTFASTSQDTNVEQGIRYELLNVTTFSDLELFDALNSLLNSN
jgi:hypothetical protein